MSETMNNFKKAAAVILAVVMVLSLTACGGKSGGKQGKSQATENGYILCDPDCETVLGTPEKTVNAQNIYDSIDYTTKMFYGRYCLPNWFKDGGNNEDIEAFRAQTTYIEDPFDSETKISAVPILIEAGYESNDKGIVHERKYDWLSVHFATETSSQEHSFKYEVKGNKLILTGVEFEYDNDTKKLKYKLLEDVKMEYEFAFSGLKLTLTNNGTSVDLWSNYSYSGEDEYIFASNYLNSDSPQLDGIIEFSFRWHEGDDSWFYVVYEYEDEDGVTQSASTDGILELNKNGLATFTVPFETGEKTYQFACFHCGDDGVIFTDGENTYYYQTEYFEYMKKDLSNNVDISLIEDLNETELKQIEQKKTDLFDDLANAFKEAGIKVTVNKKTGELAMDTTVLFGGDSAELTKEGKDFLNKFIKAYTDIAFNEKYDGFISKTIVEGHIAPVDGVTYEQGMPLSEKRANNVKDYCLSKDTGVDTAKLAKTIETVGYSNSKPVKDKDGKIDFDASRRVSFRFIINVDKAK